MCVCVSAFQSAEHRKWTTIWMRVSGTLLHSSCRNVTNIFAITLLQFAQKQFSVWPKREIWNCWHYFRAIIYFFFSSPFALRLALELFSYVCIFAFDCRKLLLQALTVINIVCISLPVSSIYGYATAPST